MSRKNSNTSRTQETVKDESNQTIVDKAPGIVLETEQEKPVASDQEDSNNALEGSESVTEASEERPPVNESSTVDKIVEVSSAVDELDIIAPKLETSTTPPIERKSTKELRESLKYDLPDEEIAAYPREWLVRYITSGMRQTKTNRGVWPVDERRTDVLTLWTGNALLDWMENIIQTPRGVSEELIWEEIFRRNRLPGNWSYDAAKAFLLNHEEPTYTKEGLLVEDRQRDAKTLDQLTYLEVRSALLGEIESTFTKSQLVSQLRKRLFLTESFSESRLLESLADTPPEATVNNTLLKSKLAEYKEQMSKYGPHLTSALAGQSQTMLYNAIRQVMVREYQEFHEGWIILLDFINENYNALFTPDKARRGWSDLKLNSKALATFEDILTLMIHTRGARNRVQEAKLYNLGQILRYVTSEKERQNIVLFYSA